MLLRLTKGGVLCHDRCALEGRCGHTHDDALEPGGLERLEQCTTNDSSGDIDAWSHLSEEKASICSGWPEKTLGRHALLRDESGVKLSRWPSRPMVASRQLARRCDRSEGETPSWASTSKIR